MGWKVKKMSQKDFLKQGPSAMQDVIAVTLDKGIATVVVSVLDAPAGGRSGPGSESDEGAPR